MRYDQLFERRARRAIVHATCDAETMLADLEALGATWEVGAEALRTDLDQEGAVFGKLLRSLVGAAEASVLAAEQQGFLSGLVGRPTLDVEELALIEDEAAEIPVVWLSVVDVSEPCQRCLDRAGERATLLGLRSRGWHPDLAHQGSWRSACRCLVVPASWYRGSVALLRRGDEPAGLAVGVGLQRLRRRRGR